MNNTPTCVRPGSGLVSWWQAEGDASDAMGNNPGVLVNDTQFGAGMVGQAFSLDGNCKSVQIPYSTNLATPSFTFETWVYPTSQIGWQAFIYGQSFGRQLVVQAGDDGYCWAALYITDPYGNFIGLGSDSEMPTGAWTHLAATWDGTYLNLYINGVLDAQGTPGVSDIGDSGCPFCIGGVNDSCGYYGQYFPGLIDEVSVYDRALFAGEINAIYQAGSAGKCTTAPVCAACPASAVSWWAAEGDASDTLGANPGTLQNGVTFTNGMVGQTFSFDGNSKSVQIPYSSGMVTPSFSFETWVNPSAQPGGQAFVFGQGYGRQLVVEPGNLGLDVAFYVSADAWTWAGVFSSAEIPLGEWTHLVGTFDGTYLSLYVNGALDQSAPAGIVPWDSGCGLSIGGFGDFCDQYGGGGQYFPGLIDEMTLYNSALTPDQVAAIYNAGSAGKCATIPASWLAHYFGPNYQNEPYAAVNADADGDGVSNLQEYLQGTDPNKIRFGVVFDTLRVRDFPATATFTVLGGVPIQLAVLVDNTNLTTANWTAYSQTVSVDPGPTEGPHDVWIGLKGFATDSVQTWAGFRLTRDTTPPAIIVTSPLAATVSQPILQLQGYSPEPLASLSCDLSNAVGLAANQTILVLDQYYDTKARDFTTNTFQAFDIPLANGVNTITLRAVDLAGNVTTLTTNFTLDYSGKTNSPVLQSAWPENGMVVCGNTFVWTGLVSDPTASVTAQSVDADGTTNWFPATVGRDGQFWIQNLPLHSGTNAFILTVQDVVPNVAVTNLTVIQGDIGLSLDPIPANQTEVTGEINSADYSVFVNGVKAAVSGTPILSQAKSGRGNGSNS